MTLLKSILIRAPESDRCPSASAMLVQALALVSSVATVSTDSNCTNSSVVDPSGCRANNDIGNIRLDSTLPLAAQIAQCTQYCCALPECDAWAVREKYSAGWARNCSVDGGQDCCLLKKRGWVMQGSIPGCTSGGRSKGPPAPPPKPGPPGPSPPAPPTPPPPPLPHGGATCSDDWDCSLGGECVSGRCSCDPWFTGDACNVLFLQRAKPDNGMQVNGTHTWGGHGLKDPSTGKWVGYFSYMAGRCDLNVWSSQSMVISAVSDTPDGPYNQNVKPTLGPWSHNAMIAKHPNGSYFLFHIGTGVSEKPIKQCDPSNPDPLYPFPAGSPQPAAATTHIADNLTGPWRPATGIPSLNNPCPFFFPNGTTLLFDRESMTMAPSVNGPWSPHTPTVTTNGSMKPEDPGVFRDARGNFHMVFNANSGHSNCPAGVPCGGHAWSRDGVHWSKPIWPAFGTIIHYTDNTTTTFDYCERPQVAQSEDGTPLTFFVGHGYRGIHTLAINFCQASDTDCVTTIR